MARHACRHVTALAGSTAPMAPGSDPKLEARVVSHEYVKRDGTRVRSLHEISLAVGAGEFVAIVGPSGCGKTTFLRILDGLEPLETGDVLIDGRSVTVPGRDRAVVFQTDSLFPWRTAAGNIRFGPELAGIDRRTIDERVDELVRVVGLTGFAHHYPHELSGGMRQRVNLARALAVDPGILLMDEPFAALDAQTREVMQTELLRVWAATGKTVVFITHQIDEAVYLADRVFVFSARPGRLRATVDVALPRPRPLSLKRTGEFGEYVERIWSMIEEQAREAALA